MASSRVGHHPSGASSRPKGQVGCRVGIRRVGGEVGGRGKISHVWERCLRLVLGLARRVGGLKLVGHSIVLLAGCQIFELLSKVKQGTEDTQRPSYEDVSGRVVL